MRTVQTIAVAAALLVLAHGSSFGQQAFDTERLQNARQRVDALEQDLRRYADRTRERLQLPAASTCREILGEEWGSLPDLVARLNLDVAEVLAPTEALGQLNAELATLRETGRSLQTMRDQLNVELGQLRGDVRQANDALAALQKQILADPIMVSTRRTASSSVDVLLVPLNGPGFVGLGALTVDYPHELKPGRRTDQVIRASLAPVRLFGTPRTDAVVGFSGTDRTLDTLQLQHGAVATRGGPPGSASVDRVPTNFQDEIVWTWSPETTKRFDGAEFNLQFVAEYGGVKRMIGNPKIVIDAAEEQKDWWGLGKDVLLLIIGGVILEGLAKTEGGERPRFYRRRWFWVVVALAVLGGLYVAA